MHFLGSLFTYLPREESSDPWSLPFLANKQKTPQIDFKVLGALARKLPSQPPVCPSVCLPPLVFSVLLAKTVSHCEIACMNSVL